jgi:hypothetical protein
MSEQNSPLQNAVPLPPLQALKLWLQHWIGLDRAIFFTILARFWQAFSGLVTLFLITRFLSASQQGYYYTFFSIVALQIVFELGFSFVILQLAAHERAYLTFLPQGGIEGDPVAHSRLASVLQKAVYWYMAAGVLMAAALIPAGLWFFSAHPTAGVAVAWRLPWISLVLAAMLAFQVDPVFSFLEGCGFVAQVAQRRFTQAILGSALCWTAMILHHGLYAPALLILGQVAVGLAYLLSNRHRKLLGNLLRYPVGENFVGWRNEIWPFQWKIAISWMCGYFIFQLFSPVLFAYQGAEAAGRMGMSLNVAGGIGAIAIAWMNTKASPFGALIARGEIRQLDHLFFRTLKQSTAMLGLRARPLPAGCLWTLCSSFLCAPFAFVGGRHLARRHRHQPHRLQSSALSARPQGRAIPRPSRDFRHTDRRPDPDPG